MKKPRKQLPRYLAPAYGPLPEFVAIDGRAYEILVVRRLRYEGEDYDGFIAHATRRVYIHAGISDARRPFLLQQLVREGCQSRRVARLGGKAEA